MAKKALLIGINHYQIPGNDLRGCVNDVKSMTATLKKYFGFKLTDITTLLDDQATTKAMRSGIQKLVMDAKAGDVVLLHYSGHGSNVPDKNGDEADNRDEILCPADLNWNDPLTDDWLRLTFDKLHPQATLTVILDCCHSGTATRAVNFDPKAPRSKFLASPWDLIATETKRKLTGKLRGTRGVLLAAGTKKSDVVTADIAEVLVSGCRDTQTSADAFIGGKFNGALTYFLVETIKKAEGKLTNRTLHKQTIAGVKASQYDQIPQLEGRATNLDRPFLSPAV